MYIKTMYLSGFTYWVVGVGHCVERTDGHGELVQDVVVGVILKVKVYIYLQHTHITYTLQ